MKINDIKTKIIFYNLQNESTDFIISSYILLYDLLITVILILNGTHILRALMLLF